jgi:hypothetical protein
MEIGRLRKAGQKRILVGCGRDAKFPMREALQGSGGRSADADHQKIAAGLDKSAFCHHVAKGPCAPVGKVEHRVDCPSVERRACLLRQRRHSPRAIENFRLHLKTRLHQIVRKLSFRFGTRSMENRTLSRR